MKKCLGPVLTGREFKGMNGAFAAMFTPFTKDGKINEESIDQLIDYGLREGLAGFYLTGSTGEGMLLTNEEHVQVYRRAVKAARGRCKLIAQVGAVRTDDAVTLACAAADAGVDWISSVAPVYFGQNFPSTLRHYKAISEATDLPFLIYAFNSTLVPERDVRLFDLKNVKGIKYTGQNFYACQRLRRMLDKETMWFAGCDELLVAALAMGDTFSGGIGLNYNIIPGHFVRICKFAAANDFAAAARVQAEVNRLVDIVVAAFADNWSEFKVFMKYVGIDCGPCRAPYAPLTRRRETELMIKIAALGIVKENWAL
ncbi:MAG TPA: dihydrodipicolinate synthase family protein [Kiritimatiellia bacterium]|nr:dihydrodipicolinate synthase family protein [Kiritimatiellia bacterium]HPS08741.1 dihydrodipicolinate synthase family protein [Kiritimatiellia bacterium]